MISEINVIPTIIGILFNSHPSQKIISFSSVIINIENCMNGNQL